jgi:hypothetical protein
MKRRSVYLSLGILIVQGLCLVGHDVRASDVAISNKRVEGCHIETFGADNALHDISQKTGVTIGFEAVQPEKEMTFVIDFQGGTLAELLNMFVSQSPDYRWEETDGGIIHVSRSDVHTSLVDVVMDYPGVLKKTREEVWEDIAKRPEVVTWMNSNRCSRGELFNGKEFRSHNDPISIPSGSKTLAQLLDETAVKSGQNFWAVLQSPPSTPCRVDIILW